MFDKMDLIVIKVNYLIPKYCLIQFTSTLILNTCLSATDVILDINSKI